MNLLILIALLAQTPQQAADELLAADRAYAAASAKTDLVSGITAMLADDVVMPAPGGTFIEGVANVRTALGANATARATWTPIRVGVSADGQHGFTYGYMTITRADSTRAFAKYMSYWVKGAAGWRVQVYKRAPREGVDVDTTLRAPSLPPRMVPASGTDHRASVAAAEQAFSDEAQKIGLAAAFRKFGSADAANMGPPNGGFIFGADAIGTAVGGDGPTDSSPVSWAADHKVFAASSGDLGITLGVIRQNAGDGRYAFFTIWHRANPSAPWRYIAE